MGDVGDMWRDLHAEERELAAKRKAENLATLRASVLPFRFENDGDVVLIRDHYYPAIDFFPTKNKWRVGNRWYIGTAGQLLDWLKMRNMK